jgi:NAD(P)H-dependent FMN reductase
VKCALDHLYHEWGGKPALIVSYGTRGGTKGAEQLRQVLLGCRMHPWEGCVELSIGTEALGGGVLSESALASWEEDEKKGELIERWRELVAIAGEGKRVVEG